MVQLSINDIFTIVALLLGGFGLFLQWKMNQVQGVKFVIPEILIDSHTDAKNNKHYSLLLLIQNIGDKMGYLRLRSILVKLTDMKHVINVDCKYDQMFQPSEQTRKRFTITDPTINIKDSKNVTGEGISSGEFVDHKGNFNHYIFTTPIKPFTDYWGGSINNNIQSLAENRSGMIYNINKSPEELWQSSKKERIALFIRMTFSQNYWFSAKDVLEEQLTLTNSLVLGETSAIATYLARLFENGYLDRQKSGSRAVKYKLTDKIFLEYPAIKQTQFNELLNLGFID